MSSTLGLGRTHTTPDDSPSWRHVLVPFVVSRAVSDTLLISMGLLAKRGTILTGFTRWDGRWYTAIAVNGYTTVAHAHHHQTPWPFFPLFPLLMRAGAISGFSTAISGIAINHLAFLFALVGLHRLARRHASEHTATLAVWLAAFGPLAFVFSMLYPSALFFAASIWAFLFIEQEHDLAAGFAAAVAALSRPDGIVVAAVLIVVAGFAARRAIRIAGPVVVTVGLWVCFNALRTGDPIRFFDAKTAWHEISLGRFMLYPTPNAAVHLLVAAIAIALVTAERDLPRAWTWYTLIYLLPSLALGIVGLGRYATETFPPYIAAATLLERRRAPSLAVLFAGLVITQAIFANLFIAQGRLI